MYTRTCLFVVSLASALCLSYAGSMTPLKMSLFMDEREQPGLLDQAQCSRTQIVPKVKSKVSFKFIFIFVI